MWLVCKSVHMICTRCDLSLILIISHLLVKQYIDIGARVECKLEPNDDKWFAGTVLQRDTNWSRSPLETPPYLIRFDYGVSIAYCLHMLVLYELPFLMCYICFISKYKLEGTSFLWTTRSYQGIQQESKGR